MNVKGEMNLLFQIPWVIQSTEYYSYDANNNVTSYTDAEGVVTNYGTNVYKWGRNFIICILMYHVSCRVLRLGS